MDTKKEPKRSWYAREWDGEKLVLYQYDEKPSEDGPYTFVRKTLPLGGVKILMFAASGIYLGGTILTRI